MFTSWIQANLCGERNQVAPNRSPDWDVHSRFSNLFQPRATSSSYMLLSPLVTLVSQSVLKQDSHATPITMVLVGATLFLATRKCGRHLARATAVHSATPVVFEHLTGSFRCFKAFSDVFNTYTSIFRIRGICRIRQHLVSGRNQQK